MFKKNIKYTVGQGINIENGEYVEIEMRLAGYFTRESFQKKVRKQFPDVTIMKVETRDETYQMDVDTFMQYATLVQNEKE